MTLPLFPPPIDWVAPKSEDWPDFSRGMSYLGVDTETKDTGLLDEGPGFLTRDSKLMGVSFASREQGSIYLPLFHPEGNVEDPEQAMFYIIDQLCTKRPKVFANAQYDLYSLRSEGIEVMGEINDIQVAAPLLDEELVRGIGGYSLENLAIINEFGGKNERKLKQAAAAFGVHPKGGIWQLPAGYVGEYAQDDAMLPVKIIEKQLLELEEEDLLDMYDLECRVLRPTFEMTWKGVRIDMDQTQALKKQWKLERESLLMEIYKEVGMRFNERSNDQLAMVAQKLGVVYNRTAAGNPSFTSEYFDNHNHPIFHDIGRTRKLKKMVDDFLVGQIEKYAVNGRIHPNYNTLRSERGGTRTTRYSSNNPNEQQVPSRDPEFGPAIRALRLPDVDEQWCTLDFNGQEVRLMVNLGVEMAFDNNYRYQSAARAATKYHHDPLWDFHGGMAEVANISRRDSKGVIFSISYGQSKDNTNITLGGDWEHTTRVLNAFNSEMPFISNLYYDCMNLADNQGYVTTILGARRRFPGGDNTHKGLNARIQGSGANLIKLSLATVYEELKKIPLSTVHDELNYSILNTLDGQEIKELMEETSNKVVKYVPMVVDMGIGENWAGAK